MGWVILDIDGSEEEIAKCLEWTRTSGVTVDDLNDNANDESLVEG